MADKTKTTVKKSVGEGRNVPIRKLAEPKDVPSGRTLGVGKPVETQHIAVVFKIKCGTWYSRHYHYQVAVTEVPVDLPVSKVRESAISACEVMREVMGKEISVLTVKKVVIGTEELMKQASERVFGSLIK